jgi:hypothetical protein
MHLREKKADQLRHHSTADIRWMDENVCFIIQIVAND